MALNLKYWIKQYENKEGDVFGEKICTLEDTAHVFFAVAFEWRTEQFIIAFRGTFS